MDTVVTSVKTNELETRIQGLFEDLKRANEKGITDTRDNLNNAISDIQEELKSVKTALNRTPEQKEALDIVTDVKNFAEFKKSKAFKSLKKDEKFSGFVRKSRPGDIYDTEMDVKTVTGNITTGADGGYGVPTVIETALALLIIESSEVRQACAPVTIGTSAYNKLINDNNVGTGWVGETGSRSQTNAPTFEKVTITPGELYAKVYVSQQMIEDVQFDAEGTIIADAGLALGRAESTAFVVGSGSNQPTGFLHTAAYTPTGYATTGTQVLNTVASKSGTAISADDVIKLIMGLPAGYRNGAKFAMSRQIQQAVRLLVDSQGRYLWSADGRLASGMAAQLLGYDVLEFNDMPTVIHTGSPVTATYPITFANFPQFYRPVDRVGVQLLRDPYSNADTGVITYRFRKRVGGGIENGAAGITLAVAGA